METEGTMGGAIGEKGAADITREVHDAYLEVLAARDNYNLAMARMKKATEVFDKLLEAMGKIVATAPMPKK